MHHPLGQPRAHRSSLAQPRRGFVLVAVLLVVVVLALSAYQFTESMGGEFKAADSMHRVGQSRGFAKSAIDYAMVLLSDPNNLANTLGNNPYDNTSAFQHIQVQPSDKPRFVGAFDIIAPLDYDSTVEGATGYRYGVTDESSKININALFKIDSSGQILINFLMTLPNMTEDIANSIVDWIDPDDDPRDNGAESDYYSGLSPAYQAKNGPLDSIEELLLVKGVTPQLLFGNDQNRNGMLDPGEDDGTGALNLGWAAFLTVFSRERNVSAQGIARINVNSSDLSALYTQLNGTIGEPMASFIVGSRLYGSGSSSSGGSSASGGAGGSSGGGGTSAAPGGGGATPTPAPTSPGGNSASPSSMPMNQASMARSQSSMTINLGSMSMSQQGVSSRPASGASAGGGSSSSGGASSGGGGGSSNSSPVKGGTLTVQQLGDLTQPATQPSSISSLFSLVNSTVTIPGQNGQPATIYSSPLNDPTLAASVMPLMLDQLTTQGLSEIPARLNINTASQVLLAALPGLSPADVETIVDQRPVYAGGGAADPTYQTTAWLLTEANLSPTALQGLDRYISASTQVYRVQAVGYFDGGGPAVRIEAVIDTNAGLPRLMYWRDLTELGKGYTQQANQQ